ncbi:hypothetical protein ABZV31_00615 [Streptomyces sp. NPDC005202]|uniref:hypothetical protein n=1 Tax=Streptomyces sp. NPDC005202 TaxID=3157021 RepID=UPI0033A9A280
MNCTLRSRCVRTLAAGTLSAALVSAGSAGAFAASSTPSPKPSMTHSTSPTTKASINVKADRTTVKAGQTVMFTGRIAGLKTGTPLVLQHQYNGKWTTLYAGTMVKKGNSYSLAAKLNTKGTEHLRVASGTAHSPTVTVKVT